MIVLIVVIGCLYLVLLSVIGPYLAWRQPPPTSEDWAQAGDDLRQAMGMGEKP